MARATVTACVNQKGGTGKTTTCENLGIALAAEGKRVLLIDLDPQGSLTISLGYPQPDELPITVTEIMRKVMDDETIGENEGILRHEEGVDLLPASITLSGLESSLVNAISRETVLKGYIDSRRKDYDHILIDCSPSLGMLTVNALAAADSLLVPVQAQYLSAKGLELLLGTVHKVKRQLNPRLKIDGILLTMVDARTNDAKEISSLIRETYGSKIKVFKTEIPRSVRAAETSKEGRSIFSCDPKGKVAEAYRDLVKEVNEIAEQRRKRKLEEFR